MRALAFLQRSADRFHLDPERMVIAGDSAGAHLAAQLGALVTTPGYAEQVGVQPAITSEQLRALVLACGPYDLDLAQHSGTPAGARFIHTVLWAYSGTRHFRTDPAFAAWSVTAHLTPAFPPCLITVGNADPLREHSERLARALREQGLEPETLFWPDDHTPALGHEYQFDLDTEPGQVFFNRLLSFLTATTEQH
jgi:acetyl esterase/lipase